MVVADAKPLGEGEEGDSTAETPTLADKSMKQTSGVVFVALTPSGVAEYNLRAWACG